MRGNLPDVKGYIFVILVCISLMISDVEHLFIYLLAICMSRKMFIQILCTFLKIDILLMYTIMLVADVLHSDLTFAYVMKISF